MKTFRDSQGREWPIEINYASLLRVKDAGVDLTDLPVVASFGADLYVLGVTLYALCQPEIQRREIADEEFHRAFNGDVFEAVTKIILEELVNFFPPDRRPALTTVLAERKKSLATVKRVMKSDLIQRAAEQQRAKIEQDLKTQVEQSPSPTSGS